MAGATFRAIGAVAPEVETGARRPGPVASVEEARRFAVQPSQAPEPVLAAKAPPRATARVRVVVAVTTRLLAVPIQAAAAIEAPGPAAVPVTARRRPARFPSADLVSSPFKLLAFAPSPVAARKKVRKKWPWPKARQASERRRVLLRDHRPNHPPQLPPQPFAPQTLLLRVRPA